MDPPNIGPLHNRWSPCVVSIEGGHCHLAALRTMISQAEISNWSHFPPNFSFEMAWIASRSNRTVGQLAEFLCC